MKFLSKIFIKKYSFVFLMCVVIFLILPLFALLACGKSDSGPGEILTQEMIRLEELVKENPGNPDMKVDLAITYSKAGFQQKAITQLQAALNLNESHQSALIALGNVYIKVNRYNEAIDLYSKVVDLNRDNPVAANSAKLEGVYYNLGFANFNLNRIDEAIQSLSQAIAIDRTDADAHYLLGASYQHKGEFDQAISSYNQAIRFAPDFVEVYQGLAKIYEKMGQANMAKYAQAMVSLNTGATNQAISQLETVISVMPDYPGAHLGLGMAYEKAGLTEQAIGAYKSALSLDANIWLAQTRLQMLGVY